MTAINRVSRILCYLLSIYKKTLTLIPLLAFLFLSPPLAAEEGAAVNSGQKTITFGVYAYIRSTELYKKMAPFWDYLQQTLSEQGVAERIEFKIYPSYESAIDALARSEVDFVRFGPVSYVLAKERNPGIRLLAMESNGGSMLFNGVISLPQNSTVNDLTDLRGKSMAFGSPRSTTGRYLAQAALVKAGIYAKDFSEIKYLGRHDKVAYAVASGNYDAGAINENTFNKYAKDKKLKKLVEFPCVTKPWVASESMDQRAFRVLQDALIQLKDPEVLKSVKRSGFLYAKDSDYELIREGMRLAEEFEGQR